ncbi:MAG: hypothetical protein KAS59_02990, partial [Alphaproteobacteria bacterium]|nr:hypothetical protein [Alphaproteobacteria bacterium]
MENSSNYLDDLLKPTPLTLTRIKGTWSYLPFESKVKILKTLLDLDDKRKNLFKYTYQTDELKDLALKDENPYIRSLAAQTVSKPYKWGDGKETEKDREDEERYNRVLTDENELVRSIVEENLRGFPKADDETAEKFWNFSHTKRLICVSTKDSFDRLSGEVFAKILQYAVKKLYPEKKVLVTEIIDVIQQYVAGNAMKEKARKAEKYAREFMDGYTEYSVGKDMESLWRVAFTLPDGFGTDLIEALPARAGFMEKIPLDDLEKISKHKLSCLFYRDDVALNEFRRKIYNEPATDKNDMLRSAAISSIAFKLEDEDFKKLTITKSDSKEEAKHKFEELRTLAQACRGATMAQM